LEIVNGLEIDVLGTDNWAEKDAGYWIEEVAKSIRDNVHTDSEDGDDGDDGDEAEDEDEEDEENEENGEKEEDEHESENEENEDKG
jgi:hypothetical protein